MTEKSGLMQLQEIVDEVLNNHLDIINEFVGELDMDALIKMFPPELTAMQQQGGPTPPLGGPPNG